MKTVQVFLVGFILIFLTACQSGNRDERGFSELALKGKSIFEAKECNQCHYLGAENVHASAPDLTDPFLANDSSFIQTHLTFVELSKMPPVELNQDEIRLVSHYIAQIHRNKYSTIAESDADTCCPVCYAPVSMEQAKASKLVLKWHSTSYYFECQKCKETFKLAPEAILMILEQDAHNHQKVTQN